MNVIFTGTTTECIAHLAQATSDNHFAKRKMIASFTGVGDQTVYRWFKEGNLPVGEPLIRLRFYMEFLGYEIQELQILDPVVRDTARLFAFGVTTLTEIAELVGYSGGRRGTDTLLAIFRGTQGVSTHRLEQFRSFVELYGDKLSERQKATHKVQLDDITASGSRTDQVPTRSLSTVRVLRPVPQNALSCRDALIESLAGSVKALIPAVRAISSDECTPEDRARLRELAGGDGVFVLANLLYRLCGERSRRMHPDNSNQHPV